MINLVKFRKSKKQRDNNIEVVTEFINNTIDGLRTTCNTRDKKISFISEMTRHKDLVRYNNEIIDQCFEVALDRYKIKLIENYL